MASYLEFYASDDVTPAAPLALSLGAGEASATTEYHLWNDIGGAQGADAAVNPRIKIEVYTGTQWVDYGEPMADGLWARATPIGVVNTGDPTFTYSAGTEALGNDHELVLPDLPANCAFKIEFSWRVPGTAADNSVSFRLVAVDDGSSIAIGAEIGIAGGHGVVPDYRDVGLRRIMAGRTAVVAGTDSVTVERGHVAYDGTLVCSVRTAHTLNQTASDGALAAGQKYIGRISQNSAGTVTATKGAKSATPAAPALPANDVLLFDVTIDYQVGGTSVIDSGDVSYAGVIRGGYEVTDAGGLAVAIGAGGAITSTDQVTFRGSSSTLAVDASDTSYIWVLPDGTFSASLTDVAPEIGSEKLAEVVTGAGSVTSIADVRSWLDLHVDVFAVELRKAAVAATGTALDWAVLPIEAELHQVRLEAGAITGGASGAYTFDVSSAAAGTPSAGAFTTIYTSQGTDDRRPSIAFDATSLTDSEIYHEVRRFAAGTRFRLDCDVIPAGGAAPTATDVRVTLLFRRYR